MDYYDVMCYEMEDPTIEELLAAEAIDFEDYAGAMYEDEMYEKYVEEMTAKHDAELAYEGGYCG